MSEATDNPLLNTDQLPDFEHIEVAHVLPAIRTILDENRRALERQLADSTEAGWEAIQRFEAREDRLAKAWSPISHLNAVMNSPALREVYQEALRELTQYSTEVAQNEELYQLFQALADSPGFSQLTTAQQRTVEHAIRDFRLAGVHLPEEQKRRYGELKQRLSELSNQFSNNLLDATQAWYKHFADASALAGLPDTALETARQAARARELEGYVITLDAPAYIAVMSHADDRALREEMYRAFVSRASALGQTADGSDPAQWDNTAIIDEMLALRHELAQLLGFNNYAERSLATKMAESTDEVMDFLQRLADAAREPARQEFAALRDFAKQAYGVEELAAWDLAYYSEKRRQALFQLSEEDLRPYFPVPKVLEGLFTVAGRLFDVVIEADDSVATWHLGARFFRVSRGGEPLAAFYLDLYARDNKRGGAWMNECRVRRRGADGLQLPVAYLTCNFTPPGEDHPALLTHSEVTTLFHEFGHGLHHMLTQVDCAEVSGINGVPWDAVELPSQFLENWCWQEEVIPLISAHYQTGEPLPRELLERMLRARNFQSAMQMVRQLEFSLFDFRLHLEYDPDRPWEPQDLLDEVRGEVAVLRPPHYNKFQNSFAHIFAGAYAAGYYSYKWAELLSADAFSLFEECGIFDPEAARRFRENILEGGGAEEATTLFRRFRGREPRIEPLLRHSGIREEGEQAYG